MSEGFFSLGQMLAGGDPRPAEAAHLEGLNTGSLIRSRQASTENALALARQRRDEQLAKARLIAQLPEFANEIGAGIDPRQITGARKENIQIEALETAREEVPGRLGSLAIGGIDPRQVTGAEEDEQNIGFRDTIADVGEPFNVRQSAAQAVQGVPRSTSSLLGPGGELFLDPDAESLTADTFRPTETGEAQIDRDTQYARLQEEKRLHPERFKSGTTVNVGGGDGSGSLGQEMAPSINIPENFDPGFAFGGSGAFGGVANTVSDVVPFMPQFFPNLNVMQTAFETVRNETLNTKVLEFPGRPTNFIAQQAQQLFPNSGSLFQGEEDALQKLNQLKTSIDQEIQIQEQLLPTFETEANRDKARATTLQFKQLAANYGAFIEAFENTQSQQGGEDAPDLRSLQPGETVIINGVQVTREE